MEKLIFILTVLTLDLKKFGTIDKEKISDLLKVETTVYMKQCCSIVCV